MGRGLGREGGYYVNQNRNGYYYWVFDVEVRCWGRGDFGGKRLGDLGCGV